MADSCTVRHPKVATITFLDLVFKRAWPYFIATIQDNVVHDTCIPFGIFPGWIFFLSPFEFNSKMKITIVFFSGDIAKCFPAHMQHVSLKLKNFFRVLILRQSPEKGMPL